MKTGAREQGDRVCIKHMYTHVCRYVHIFVFVFVYVHVYVHTRHTHTRTHTRITYWLNSIFSFIYVHIYTRIDTSEHDDGGPTNDRISTVRPKRYVACQIPMICVWLYEIYILPSYSKYSVSIYHIFDTEICCDYFSFLNLYLYIIHVYAYLTIHHIFVSEICCDSLHKYSWCIVILMC